MDGRADRLKESIFLIGLPGAGKSTVGKIVASKTGIDFFDSDEEVLNLVRIDHPEIATLLDMYGKIETLAFRQYEARVLATLEKRGNSIVATGGGFVDCQASFNLLSRSGFVVFLDCDISVLEERISLMKPRPMFQELGIIGKLRVLERERKEKYRELAKLILDGDRNPEVIADEIVQKIGLMG